MKVHHIPCGTPVNESEELAIRHLCDRLRSTQGDGEWLLVTNHAFSVSPRAQSDEIDMIIIGPPGVRVIEIKHWQPRWINENGSTVDFEAERVMAKARKVGTTLRNRHRDLPHVDAGLLITTKPSELKSLADKIRRGVVLYTLDDWREVANVDSPVRITEEQVRAIARAIEPRIQTVLDGSMARFAGLVNLKLQSPKEERYHRIYSAIAPVTRDKVILHLYDYSASSEKQVDKRARRECEVLHALQRYPWAPRILDSFQEVKGYPGEMCFFTIVDPAAPSLAARKVDHKWTTNQRLNFARDAVEALRELHGIPMEDGGLVHRNLNPDTIRVQHDGSPLFTGFHLTRVPADISISGGVSLSDELKQAAAPEVRDNGLAAADQRSDVYSLCLSLHDLFAEDDDYSACEAVQVLTAGLKTDPQERAGLSEISLKLGELVGIPPPLPEVPPVRFWSEGLLLSFRNRRYRVVTRLGSGGIGTTFKVVEIDPETDQECGPFVAKTVNNAIDRKRVLRAYTRARPHLSHHASLSTIYEVSESWSEDGITALLRWNEGVPLAEFTGLFPELAENLGEADPEQLAVRWLRDLLGGLECLHHAGLIHGDVSLKNIIVKNSQVVLTDYDFVTGIGESATIAATPLYSAPLDGGERIAARSDDIYALAASFFHLITGMEPFQHPTPEHKKLGLNWAEAGKGQYPVLAGLLERATHQDPAARFQTVADALKALKEAGTGDGAGTEHDEETDIDHEVDDLKMRPGEVEWLTWLLQSYPGSRYGNQETRGLDTEFASKTYVDTGLEESLLSDVRDRKARLVVLCGNAGDGKTALLQRLAGQLGLGQVKSSERILKKVLAGNLQVCINLDGSASWQGRSADDLLDEFMGSFHDGAPEDDIVHLLAINDGRLLEWISGVEGRIGRSTTLTQTLESLLRGEETEEAPYLRFINLNHRSLVGGITEDHRDVQTRFLERLVDQLYGGESTSDIWKPCMTCTARERCEVFRAMQLFGPEKIPTKVDAGIRIRARARLFEALQAVHLRGEIHITARELRAALVFALFGLHSCSDYHNESTEVLQPYWDRMFDPLAVGRQGELLEELVRFDPGLEAHAFIDRYLSSPLDSDTAGPAPHYGSSQPLESSRRRAYFEWTEDHVLGVGGDRDALALARGENLRLFRDLALLRAGEEVGATELCARLCRGISGLEDLPRQALERPSVVPLRVTPRTPTETAFWVEKPLHSFILSADVPPAAEGLDRLHRQVWLTYRYRDGQTESLRMGADLFHLLLELAEGYQLGDVSSDDTFAHLAIFIQRISREDERRLMAWNPMQDDAIFSLTATEESRDGGPRQILRLKPVKEGRVS